MIELLTGGGFIVDLTILSKEQIEILETLKKSILLNSPLAIKVLTYFQDAEEEETPEGIKYKFPWDDIKKDFITFTREYFNQYL